MPEQVSEPSQRTPGFSGALQRVLGGSRSVPTSLRHVSRTFCEILEGLRGVEGGLNGVSKGSRGKGRFMEPYGRFFHLRSTRKHALPP